MICCISVFLSAFLAVLAFILTRMVCDRIKFPMRILILLSASLLSIPSLLCGIYYLHVIPDYTWFYTIRSYAAFDGLVLFVGIAGGCAASFLPRLLIGFPLFGVIFISSIPLLKPVFSPLDFGLLHDSWNGDACLQSTASTCGPASICSILKYYHIDSSEKEVACAAHSYTGGTEAWYLARYVRNKGLYPNFIFNKTFSPDVALPALVGVTFFGIGHFIAVISNSNDNVTFIDPLSGKQTVPMSEFLKRYKFTGFHMSVTPK